MNCYFRLLILLSAIATEPSFAQEQTCIKSCNAPFGTLIGQSFLTKAYSNCSGDCVKNEDNFITLPQQDKKILTGMKWQCVEYARRWLIENKGITFGDVKYAYHIWDLKFGENIHQKKPIHLHRFQNKRTKHAPQVGDLLIYSNAMAITGHVAVIVSVDHDNITIAEQNYFNRTWEGKDYARRLLLDKNAKGNYRIFDDSLIGWVRFE